MKTTLKAFVTAQVEDQFVIDWQYSQGYFDAVLGSEPEKACEIKPNNFHFFKDKKFSYYEHPLDGKPFKLVQIEILTKVTEI
jgi:hypothetical protein